MQALPIDGVLPEVLAALRARDAVVLEAPPGAGKTTRVPPALLDAGLAGNKEILVLQPRRLAARLAAARVAQERGEALGGTIGYQVRFDDVSSARTRVRFLTEGLLTRRLVSDPQLREAGIVVLDEFHERHLAGDLGLALLRQLQRSTRPDLKLVVMSATLDAGPIAAWLGDCPKVRSEGRRFEVAIEHLPQDDDRFLDQQVLAAVKRLVADGLDGDVLVFLPGAGEIRRAESTLSEFAQRHALALHVLHGDLPPAEQDRAVRPGPGRKLILSTNVAETSVTIEGIAAVIDAGLARVASHSPWSGMPTLKLAKVSKASATQRAGRAGRTRAGRCLRLYTKGDFEGRPAADTPEIRRSDLAEAVLALRASGVTAPSTFPFFEAPPPAALAAADGLLQRLGAIASDGTLSSTGERMLRFPLHPRQARLLIEAERRGIAREGAALAALVGERDIRMETRARLGPGNAGAGGHRGAAGPSDLLELFDRLREGQATSARSAGLEPGAMQSVGRVQQQLQRLTDSRFPPPPDDATHERALLECILAGWPDRVARRRKPKAPELLLDGGVAATLEASSVVLEPEFVVAVDAEERKGGVVVRLASGIEPEWLLELFPEAIADHDALEWNAAVGRVDRVTRLSYGTLALDETRAPAAASEAATAVLAQAALAAGASKFEKPEHLEHLKFRLVLLRGAYPEAAFPDFDDALITRALLVLCEGRTRFDEIPEGALIDALTQSLTREQARLLAAAAPDRVTLTNGRSVQVHYEPGKPAWIESRLQDFFGLGQGPAICSGRVPLVLHLLAPNMRAVQVTTDLAGFWERHYPAVRKELMRKYPRHAWPEDGRTAVPPPPKPPRPPRR